MPQRSDVDRRAKRYLAVQCVADTGHRDAPGSRMERIDLLPERTLSGKQIVYRFSPLTVLLAAYCNARSRKR